MAAPCSECKHAIVVHKTIESVMVKLRQCRDLHRAGKPIHLPDRLLPLAPHDPTTSVVDRGPGLLCSRPTIQLRFRCHPVFRSGWKLKINPESGYRLATVRRDQNFVTFQPEAFGDHAQDLFPENGDEVRLVGSVTLMSQQKLQSLARHWG
jgi:hypothetical protein